MSFKKNVFALLGIILGGQVLADEAGLPLHGFADAGGGISSKLTPAEQKIKGFKIGTVDFYLSPEFDDGVKSLMEIAFEPSHSDGSIGIDVERLQVGYTFNDYLTLWSGRFHTPFGIWNTAYHHGSQLLTSIYRPKFLEFEDGGGILPAHSVGLWGKGQVKVDQHKFLYNVYVANGSKINLDNGSAGTLDMNNYRNDKNHYMIGGTASYMATGGALESMEVGVHGLSSVTNAYTASDYSVNATHSTDVMMLGGFFHYDNHGVEVLGEYYGFTDKDKLTAGATKRKSNAQFVQVGYDVTETFTPYVRYEKAGFDQNDNYFADQKGGRSYERYSLGVRKDINPRTALKLEWVNTTHDGSEAKYNTIQYNYAVRF